MNISNQISIIDKILREYSKSLPFELQAFIGAELGVKEKPDNWKTGNGVTKKMAQLANATFSNSTLLRVGSGKLIQSFLPQSNDSLTKTSYSNFTLDATIGSALKYASVHEHGAFIESKGKMQFYFLYLYKQTKNDFWLILAKTVFKKGGVNIPARPYFNTALQKYKDSPDGYNQTMKKLLDELMKSIEIG